MIFQKFPNTHSFIIFLDNLRTMSSITLLGSLYAKQNQKLLIQYAQRNLSTIYTLSSKSDQSRHNQPLVLLTKRPLTSSSILLSKDEVPKGFEKFFPKANKSGDKSSASSKAQETNPFKKFISNESGGGGSGGKSNEDRFDSNLNTKLSITQFF